MIGWGGGWQDRIRIPGRRAPSPEPEWAAESWDGWFRRWIEEGRRSGRDPNDIGDEEWEVDSRVVAETHYLPLIGPDDRVLELGPGTGRITRYVMPRCRHMVLVDYSSLVCQWLEEYLSGKGTFETHRITEPVLDGVPDGSVDVVIAHGVVEHLDFDDTLWYLESFHRVLRPGGRVRFNYENLMSEGGVAFLRQQRAKPGKRDVFRFHHPEGMNQLARMAGFRKVESQVSDDRWAFLTAVK